MDTGDVAHAFRDLKWWASRIYGFTRHCFDIRFSKLWSWHSIAWSCSITFAAVIWCLGNYETHLKSFVWTLEAFENHVPLPTFNCLRRQYPLLLTNQITQPQRAATTEVISDRSVVTRAWPQRRENRDEEVKGWRSCGPQLVECS